MAPDLATLERAHYRAMAIQDAEASPPVQASLVLGRNYLLGYVAACGVGQDRAELLATEIAERPRSGTLAYAGLGVKDGLRALAALGLPLGVVSNSDGTVAGDLRRESICYAPGPSQPGQEAAGVPMGVIVDSAVVGVAKPDPRIFGFALDALGVPAGGAVLHVGDSLRYDVAGARGRPAAGAHGPVRVLPGPRRPPARPQPAPS